VSGTPDGRCADDAGRQGEPPGLPVRGPVMRPPGGWRPWHGKPRTRDVLCLLAIVVSAVYALATIPLTPELISSHPVLLEVLTGGTSSIISAGAYADVDNKLQLAVVVVAALPGIMRFDWVYWWAGRLWGHRIVERLGQRSPRIDRGGRAAGWAGLPLLAFVLWDTLGSAAWISVVAFSGYLLGSDGVQLAGLVSRYALVTIIVLVIALIAPQAWHSWREWRAAKAAAGGLVAPGVAAPAVPGLPAPVVPGPGVPAPAVPGPGGEGIEPPGMSHRPPGMT